MKRGILVRLWFVFSLLWIAFFVFGGFAAGWKIFSEPATWVWMLLPLVGGSLFFGICRYIVFGPKPR